MVRRGKLEAINGVPIEEIRRRQKRGEDVPGVIPASVDTKERSRKEKAAAQFGDAGREAVQRDIAVERTNKAIRDTLLEAQRLISESENITPTNLQTAPQNLVELQNQAISQQATSQQPITEQGVQQVQQFGGSELPFNVNAQGEARPGLNTVLALPGAAVDTALSTPEAQQVASSAAQIIDAASSIFSARKSAGAIASEARFNDLSKTISDGIERVRQGKEDPVEVEKAINRAENAISALQSEIKGLNKLNLRYQLSQGREIEDQIYNFQSTLAQYREELEIAKVEGRQARVNSLAQQLLNQRGIA